VKDGDADAAIHEAMEAGKTDAAKVFTSADTENSTLMPTVEDKAQPGAYEVLDLSASASIGRVHDDEELNPSTGSNAVGSHPSENRQGSEQHDDLNAEGDDFEVVGRGRLETPARPGDAHSRHDAATV